MLLVSPAVRTAIVWLLVAPWLAAARDCAPPEAPWKRLRARDGVPRL